MDGINKNNFVCVEALLESGQMVLMGKQKYGFLVARHGWKWIADASQERNHSSKLSFLRMNRLAAQVRIRRRAPQRMRFFENGYAVATRETVQVMKRIPIHWNAMLPQLAIVCESRF